MSRFQYVVRIHLLQPLLYSLYQILVCNALHIGHCHVRPRDGPHLHHFHGQIRAFDLPPQQSGIKQKCLGKSLSWSTNCLLGFRFGYATGLPLSGLYNQRLFGAICQQQGVATKAFLHQSSNALFPFDIASTEQIFFKVLNVHDFILIFVDAKFDLNTWPYDVVVNMVFVRQPVNIDNGHAYAIDRGDPSHHNVKTAAKAFRKLF